MASAAATTTADVLDAGFKKDCDQIIGHVHAKSAQHDWAILSAFCKAPGLISGHVKRGVGVIPDVPTDDTHVVFVMFRSPLLSSDWSYYDWSGQRATSVENALKGIREQIEKLPRKMCIRVLDNLKLTFENLHLTSPQVNDPQSFLSCLHPNPAQHCFIYSSNPYWELCSNAIPLSWSSNPAPAFNQKFLVIDPSHLIQMLKRSDGFRASANPRQSQNHREDLNMQEWEIWEPFFKTFETYRFFSGAVHVAVRASDFFQDHLFRFVNAARSPSTPFIHPDNYKNSFTRALRQRTQLISQILSKYLQPVLKNLLISTLLPEAQKIHTTLAGHLSPELQCVLKSNVCLQQEPVFHDIFFFDDAISFPFEAKDAGIFVSSDPALFDTVDRSKKEGLQIHSAVPPFCFATFECKDRRAYFVLTYCVETYQLSCKFLSNFPITQMAFSFEEPSDPNVDLLQTYFQRLKLTAKHCRKYAKYFNSKLPKNVFDLASLASLPLIDSEMPDYDQKKVLDSLLGASSGGVAASAPALAPISAAVPVAASAASSVPGKSVFAKLCSRPHDFKMVSSGEWQHQVWSDQQARKTKVEDANQHNDVSFKFEKVMLNVCNVDSQQLQNEKFLLHFTSDVFATGPPAQVDSLKTESVKYLKDSPKTPNFLHTTVKNQLGTCTVMVEADWDYQKKCYHKMKGFFQHELSAASLISLALEGYDASRCTLRCTFQFTAVSGFQGLYEIDCTSPPVNMCDLRKCCIIARLNDGREVTIDQFNSTRAFRLSTSSGQNPIPINVNEYKGVSPKISMHMYERLGIPKDVVVQQCAFHLELLNARHHGSSNWYKQLNPDQLLNLMILATCNSAQLSREFPGLDQLTKDLFVEKLKSLPLIDITAFKNVVDNFSIPLPSEKAANVKAFPFLTGTTQQDHLDFHQNTLRLYSIRCSDFAHKDDDIDSRDATASVTTVIELSLQFYKTYLKQATTQLPVDIANFWQNVNLSTSPNEQFRMVAEWIHRELSSQVPFRFEQVRESDLKSLDLISQNSRTAVYKVHARENSCEEGEVFKKHLHLDHHQAELDREIDTFRLFHPQEYLLTTAKIVVDASGKAIGFLMKEMDRCLPNYFIASDGYGDQPPPPVNTEILVAMYRVSQALAALHEKGSSHLDVSPGNILFSRNYRNCSDLHDLPMKEIIRGIQVFLSDFGHSNHSQIQDQQGSATGTFRGTPPFQAPMLLGNSHRNPRDKDDMFSFGLVFLQALFPLDRCNGIFDCGTSLYSFNASYASDALKHWDIHFENLRNRYQKVFLKTSPIFNGFPNLLEIFLNCLNSDEDKRPSAKEVSIELCQMLSLSKSKNPPYDQLTSVSQILPPKLYSVFFPEYVTEVVARPNFDVSKMVYTGTVNMLGYPHSSSGKLVVHFENVSGVFEAIYVYEGSFEHGCFTGHNCTVRMFKDEAMPQEAERVLFSGEFRNFVFIRGREYAKLLEKKLVFEGSKNYSPSCSPSFYFNGTEFIDRDTGEAKSKSWVEGKGQN